MNMKLIVLLFASCIALTSPVIGQGRLKVEGYTIHNDKKGKKIPLPNINLSVYKGTEKVDEQTSNKKGFYKVELEFGFQYKVVFEHNDGYIDMSFAVDAKVPPAKQDINPSVGLDVPLFETGTSEIDTLKYKFPFTKFKFDGNKKFIDDAKYLSDFEKGLFKEYKAAQKQVKKDAADKAAQAKLDATAHYIMIGGKLMAGDPPKNVIRNMKVVLLNDKGTVVETATTDKFGKFSFTKLLADKNFTIKMDENDSLKLAGTKITMYNRVGKEIFVTTSGQKGGFKFQLLAGDKANLFNLEIEDNCLLIAGTLETMIDDKSKPVAKTRVTLVNMKTGEIYETVETDVSGKFVFSKLPPDKNFAIRLEDISTDLANLKIVLRDRNGNEIKSGTTDGFGKFRFELLASDSEMLNNMQVEESDLKMDIMGKLSMADDKNSPLSNIKVELLDDAGAVLQTTTTNDKGMFVFNNLVLFGGYFFKLDEADAKVAVLDAFVLAEKNQKPVKEYKIESKQNIKYRILASDQKSLGRLYLK